MKVDAIVNAANTLMGSGGGLNGHIRRLAGSELDKEKVGTIAPGECVVTKGYNLPAKYIIHTVGPHNEESPILLKSCYHFCLHTMLEKSLKTIAIPCISTGHYNYSPVKAANIALETVRNFLELHEEEVERIILCVFSLRDEAIYEELMPLYFPFVS